MSSAETPNSGRKLFYGLFVFPLLIAVGMAVLLCTVVLLTNEQETPETLVTAIKTGSPTKRWQKAFELSNELNRRKNDIRSEGLVNEMVRMLEDTSRYDPKTRSYIALALGHFRSPISQHALEGALDDPSEDVQIYALWSLGVAKAGASVPKILPFLSNQNEDLRKTGAYVLGVIGDKQVLPDLRRLLEDKTPDVQWNAALALARLGDDSGLPVLLKMLDRQSLEGIDRMNDAQIETVMLNAIKGVALVGDKKSDEILKNVSREDKSLKVRQAAINALESKPHR